MRLRTNATLAFLPRAAAFIVAVTFASRRGIERIVLEEAVSRVHPQAVALASRLAPHFVSRGEKSLLPPLQVTKAEGTANSVTFTASCDWPNMQYEWYSGQTGDTRFPVNADPGNPDRLTVHLPVRS
jgi:hypothetical protein